MKGHATRVVTDCQNLYILIFCFSHQLWNRLLLVAVVEHAPLFCSSPWIWSRPDSKSTFHLLVQGNNILFSIHWRHRVKCQYMYLSYKSSRRMMHINALLLFFSGRIGMVSVANAVIRQENVLALWKGLVPVGVIEPWSSTNYMCTKIIFVILRIIWLTCFFPFFSPFLDVPLELVFIFHLSICSRQNFSKYFCYLSLFCSLRIITKKL